MTGRIERSLLLVTEVHSSCQKRLIAAEMRAFPSLVLKAGNGAAIIEVAFLAAASTVSLPAMPTWDGIQKMWTRAEDAN